MQIQGTTALVTGAASGLGEATARELARLGAKVAVLDVNAALAQQVAEQLNTDHGAGTAVSCHCDITQTESVQAALDAATTALGPARILMNIAGIGTAKRVVGKDGNAAALEDFAPRGQRQSGGRLQHQPLVCRCLRQAHAWRRR